MIKQYIANIANGKVKAIYNKNASRKVNGITYSNKGIGYDYSIKLVNGQLYSFDMSIPKNKFMVEKLISQGKLEEIKESKEAKK